MKYLIVFTHPQRESFNGAILDRTLKALDAQSQEYKILDLYAEGFNPVLDFGPLNRRRAMHEHPDTARHRELILWADKIVFIYPIWWGRPPAMLLGFIDRLFATGFAYKHRPGKLFPEGLLGGRETICVSTMQGPSGYLQYWLGNAHQILMKRALFSFVGIKKVRFVELANIEGTDKQRLRALSRFDRFFAKSLHAYEMY